MPPFIDLTNHRYGRWTVRQLADRPRYWRCVCDCGKHGEVTVQNLRSGQSHSCGCATIESTRKRFTVHGATAGRTKPPEYQAWTQAKDRCYNTNNQNYASYGGRGIVMCDKWKTNYAAFIADMGPRPDGYTLDRIDSNGPYAPENCRWATRMTQSNNTRQCIYTVYHGDRVTLAALARLMNVDYSALRIRVKRGQTPADAVYSLQHGKSRLKR